jgi:hypothetical protein
MCGKVEAGTRNGRWYTVKCQQSIMGNNIELRTTRNDYLSISGIEVYSGMEQMSGGSTITTTYNIPANTRIGFNMSSVRQSTNYGNNRFPASNGFSNGARFSHTNRGVGQWWEVQFNQQYYVDRVKILNRRDCCGGRLARTKVFVDNQVCGEVQNGTRNG